MCILSCSHLFHERCIEPGLLRHRTCLECKCDLLKARGTALTVKNEEKSLAALVANEAPSAAGRRISVQLH